MGSFLWYPVRTATRQNGDGLYGINKMATHNLKPSQNSDNNDSGIATKEHLFVCNSKSHKSA